MAHPLSVPARPLAFLLRHSCDVLNYAIIPASILAFSPHLLAQDPAKTLPRNYQIAFENNFVEVVRVHYQAHEKLPLHDHSQRPTVYVYLTDSGPVRFSHVEEQPFALTRRPVKAGDFRVSPGRLEKHQVENIGNIPTEFLRVELKRVPLGLDDFQFRGNWTFDLTKTAITSQFASPQIAIQRCVVAAKDRAQPFTSARPVLLIAFSHALVQTGSAAPKSLKRGDLYWLNPQQPMHIESTPGATAHLLAITFLQ